jgi:hypothetical protein
VTAAIDRRCDRIGRQPASIIKLQRQWRPKAAASGTRRIDETGFTMHNNTAESFFAPIKRGPYGVYHKMRKKHLHRYCAEYGFRWNYRKVNDSARTEAALGQIVGKRLTYFALAHN